MSRISYEEFLGDSPKQTSANNSQIVSSGQSDFPNYHSHIEQTKLLKMVSVCEVVH